MESFRNILAAVHLQSAGTMGGGRFEAASAETIETALWAARKTSARLTFFSVFDVPHSEHLPEQERRRVLDEADRAGRKALEELASHARRQGIEADSRVAHGKAWREIVRQAVRERHDLVVAGGAERHIPWRFLLGGTVMKVVHNCPCPVWVTKVGPDSKPLNVLIATDLGEASEQVLQIGAAMTSLIGGKAHLLHVVDDPLARMQGAGLIAQSSRHYVESARVFAERELAEQLACLGEAAAANIELHVIKGSRLPDTDILEFIDQKQIDLLVMGTISRGGRPGVLVGNTAERLLPYLHCSLLAVKPREFVCPVSLIADEKEPAASAG